MKQKKESMGHKFPSIDTMDLVSNFCFFFKTNKLLITQLSEFFLFWIQEFQASPPEIVIQDLQQELENE